MTNTHVVSAPLPDQQDAIKYMQHLLEAIDTVDHAAHFYTDANGHADRGAFQTVRLRHIVATLRDLERIQIAASSLWPDETQPLFTHTIRRARQLELLIQHETNMILRQVSVVQPDTETAV